MTHHFKASFSLFQFSFAFPSIILTLTSFFFSTILISEMNKSCQKFSESHPSMFVDKIMAVQNRRLNPFQYMPVEFYARVDQVTEPDNSLRGINEAHCHALAEHFRNSGYDYERNMLTVYFSSTVSPDCATNVIAERSVDSLIFLKDWYCIVILDDRHWRCSIELLRGEDVGNGLRSYCGCFTQFKFRRSTFR